MKLYSSRLSTKDIKNSNLSKIPNTSRENKIKNPHFRRVNSYSSVNQDLKFFENDSLHKSQVNMSTMDNSTHNCKRPSNKSDNILTEKIRKTVTHKVSKSSPINIFDINLKENLPRKRKNVRFSQEFLTIVNIESFKKYYSNSNLIDSLSQEKKVTCKCLIF